MRQTEVQFKATWERCQALAGEDLSATHIANEIGRSVSYVCGLFHSRGVSIPNRRSRTTADRKRLAFKHFAEGGHTLDDVAAKLKVGKDAIRRYELEFRKANPGKRRTKFKRNFLDKKRAAELLRSGQSVREVAKTLGCCQSVVNLVRQKVGVRSKYRWSDATWQQCLDLLDEGKTYKEIAKAIGKSVAAVSTQIRRKGLRPLSTVRSRYLDRQRRAFELFDLNNELPLKKLMEILGVVESTVFDLKRKHRNHQKRLMEAALPKGNGWKPQDEAILGTMPDKEAAKLVGRSAKSVYMRRYRLGIPEFRTPSLSRGQSLLNAPPANTTES